MYDTHYTRIVYDFTSWRHVDHGLIFFSSATSGFLAVACVIDRHSISIIIIIQTLQYNSIIYIRTYALQKRNQITRDNPSSPRAAITSARTTRVNKQRYYYYIPTIIVGTCFMVSVQHTIRTNKASRVQRAPSPHIVNIVYLHARSCIFFFSIDRDR